MIEHFHMQICTALHSTAQHCTALVYCRAHSHNDWGSNLARTNRTSESCRNWAKACGSFKLYRALGQIQWLHTRKSFKEKIKKQLLIYFNILVYRAGMIEQLHRVYSWDLLRLVFIHGQNSSPVMCPLGTARNQASASAALAMAFVNQWICETTSPHPICRY